LTKYAQIALFGTQSGRRIQSGTKKQKLTN